MLKYVHSVQSSNIDDLLFHSVQSFDIDDLKLHNVQSSNINDPLFHSVQSSNIDDPLFHSVQSSHLGVLLPDARNVLLLLSTGHRSLQRILLSTSYSLSPRRPRLVFSWIQERSFAVWNARLPYSFD